MRNRRFRTLSIAMTGGLLLLGMLCVPGRAEVIEVEHVYMMGDNDSRSEAVRMCYAEAERQALERVGVYMEARTEMSNFTLAADEVRSFSAAIVQVEHVSDTVQLEGQHLSVHCRSRVHFDAGEVRRTLQRIAENPSLRQELKQTGDAIDTARTTATRPPAPQPGTPPPPPGARPERDRALHDLEALKRKREDILERNRVVTRAGRVAVARGMSRAQVGELLGPPQAVHSARRGGHDYHCERFGGIWVVYQDDAAMCVRNRLENRPVEGLCNCAGTTDTFVWR